MLNDVGMTEPITLETRMQYEGKGNEGMRNKVQYEAKAEKVMASNESYSWSGFFRDEN